MIDATNLKKGTTFLINNTPYRVIKYFHQKLGRGGATVRVALRNLEKGVQEVKTFHSTEKFQDISTSKKKLQYLYSDANSAYFMDSASFEQVEIPKSVISDKLNFIKEANSVNVLFWDERPLSVEIPTKVILEVIETTPGVKGNSATNVYKPATLENDLHVNIPLFVNEGDRVWVDTRTGEYLERVSTT